MADPLYFETSNYAFAELPVTAASLCTAFAHAATLHGSHLGILRGFDATRDCGWVILSLGLKINHLKPASTSFRIETWISTIEGAAMVREFRITYTDRLEQEQVLAEAAQSFVLFDRATRKIVLLPRAKRDELKGRARQLKFKLKMSRRKTSINAPASLQRTAASMRRTVVRDNVDHNGHLNSAVYLAWLSEWIDAPTEHSREVAVEFLREATLGDLLDVHVSSREAGRRSFAFIDPASGRAGAEADFLSDSTES